LQLYLDRRAVLRWLHVERFRKFRQCPLYSEYQLAMCLRDTDARLPSLTDRGERQSQHLLDIDILILSSLLDKKLLRLLIDHDTHIITVFVVQWHNVVVFGVRQ